ncbi:thioredoxin-related transmembrane protein 1 [Prorops nasuta]|uniref:thioredoxin-related transmembrane protein 1 n=1 Tax=Prorops nasuta TaxID=863751 RepID=UPI0034D01100
MCKMPRTNMDSLFYIVCFSLIFGLSNANTQYMADTGLVEQLNEENWERILTGEWMVEFYAPWCPACKGLEPIWEQLASHKTELKINVGKVDVTDSPGLTGRFVVTTLPTIYHVKDGVFRQYKSPRDKASLVDFVLKEVWKKVDPIPSWKSPNSFQMSVISQIFRMSQLLREIHSKLTEDFGLPTWGSYLIFAIATIGLGAILGLIVVFLIDFVYAFICKLYTGDEEIVQHVKDDLVDEEGLEKEADNEKKDDSKAEDTKAEDSKEEPSSPNVRKRKPRKAD